MTDVMMEVDEGISVDFLGAGNCLGLEGLRGEQKWRYTETVLARTEVLEIPVALLCADAQLCETLHGTFSAFSSVDDDARLEALCNKPVVAAISHEISTGIVDGTNLLVMDMDLCIRCGNCSMACHKVHGQSRLLRRGIHIERPKKIGKEATQHVLAPSVCMHCKDPECLTGCPTGAIFPDPKGKVHI